VAPGQGRHHPLAPGLTGCRRAHAGDRARPRHGHLAGALPVLALTTVLLAVLSAL